MEPEPYCKPHASHFCPCCKPHLYDPHDPIDAKYIAGWEDIAPIVPIARPSAPSTAGRIVWTLRLTDEQSAEAIAEALRRKAMSSGRHKVYDPGAKGTYQDVISCKGELAFSLMTGLEWTGRGQQGLSRHDVGDFYEVRTVDESWKGLVFRPGDDPQCPFVLTIVDEDDVGAMGWQWGGVIATDRYLQPPSRMSNAKWWLAKPAALQPMDELPGAPYDA